MTRPPPRSPLFPYTTLFRSHTSELQSHSHLVCRLLEFRRVRSEEHTSELQSHSHLVCRLLLEKKNLVDSQSAPKGYRQVYRGIGRARSVSPLLFFLNDTATTEFYPLSLPDALPISRLNSSHTLISYAVFCLRDESVTGVQT